MHASLSFSKRQVAVLRVLLQIFRQLRSRSWADTLILRGRRIVEMRFGLAGRSDPFGSCARFRSRPVSLASVACAAAKDLKPIIGRVIFLINRWSCSMMLLRYLTCRVSISQYQPARISAMFMLSSPARLAPLLSITTLSGQPFRPTISADCPPEEFGRGGLIALFR